MAYVNWLSVLQIVNFRAGEFSGGKYGHIEASSALSLQAIGQFEILQRPSALVSVLCRSSSRVPGSVSEERRLGARELGSGSGERCLGAGEMITPRLVAYA